MENIFKDKFNLKVILVSFIIFILIFLSIKNELFYNATNYIYNYVNYYIDKYLGGNSKLLINELDNSVLLHIESDTANIISAVFIYVGSFSNILFKLFVVIAPIIIFYKVSRELYCEIYKNYSICKITRIGFKKYINSIFLKNCIESGLLLLIPRLLYFLILSIFFPNGVSDTHYLLNTSFAVDTYLYSFYTISPYLLILFDLILCFLYGIFLSLLSILIISFTKNKGLSYLIYIFSIAFISIVLIFLNQVPIVMYLSIFTYFKYVVYDTINYYIPFITILSFIIIFILIDYICIYKKVRNNL